MTAAPLDDLFETCLQRIQHGAAVDEVLADYPEKAQELRPMLETAFELQRLGGGAVHSQAAQNRSRARFLAAASAASRPGFRFHFLRFAAAGLVVIAILGAVLWGTSWVSAQAIPGDVLYPVKLIVEKIQISAVQDSPARLELEEQLDNRRLDEVIQLKRIQRKQPVSFGGLLVLTERGEWQAGGITLSFPPAFPPPDILIGTYVQINGFSNDDIVEVDSIAPRQYQWRGQIQSLEPGSWVVSGIPIHLNQETIVKGNLPRAGAAVRVTAVRLADDIYMAVLLEVSAVPAPSNSPTSLASETAQNSAKVRESESGSEKQETSATPSPRPATATSTGAGTSGPSLTPAAKTTAQPSATRAREPEKSQTPTTASSATRIRATQTREATAVKPSATRPAATSVTTGEPDEKSSD